MKPAVASFCLLLLSLLAATGVAQTGSKKQPERASARSGNLQICQGVPLPDGYVIVAYVSTTKCPHGAYVLSKKEPPKVPDPVASGPPQSAPQQQPVKSRPRKVNVAQESRPPSLRGTSDQRDDIAANKVPDSVALASTPSAVPEPSVEEVSAGDVVRINTTLVTVPVSVVDRNGRFVPDLRREDFRVFENGVEQTIAYFEPTEKPFTVALVLDTSASTRFHLWEIKEAAIAFAKQLRPQDRVLVVTFNDEVLLLTEATNDLNVISAVIEHNANAGSSTRLYDAVNLVVNERLNKIEGRKAIVLFTDGVDTSSYLANYQSTLHDAEELDALIYPIQYDTTDYMRAMQGGGSVSIVTTTSNWPFPGNSSSRTTQSVPSNNSPIPGATKADYERADLYLKGMAEKTGGRLYQANDRTQLAQAFSRIAEELRRQYSLGYYPQNGNAESGEQRAINVRVQKPNVAVRARNSYVKRAATQ
jgi:Ca-activated chloride channel family protein